MAIERHGKLDIDRCLTNSFRNLYTSCPRRWYYRTVEKLTPVITPRALQIGSFYHAALADLYGAPLGEQSPDPAGAVLTMLRDFEGELDQLPDREAAQKALEDARANANKAMELFDRYVAHWGDDSQWETLAVEHRIEMRLKAPSGNPSHWRYAGTLDRIVRDLADGQIKVIDYKTTGITSREAYAEQLMLDPQSPGYIMLLGSQPDWQEGGPIGTFIFDVIRKKAPSDPKTLVCKGKCAKAANEGRIANPDCPKCHGTNVTGISTKTNIDTTPEKFRETLAQYPHLDEADYVEHLAMLEARSDSWLYRIELAYTPDQIDDFHDECYEITRTISEARFYTRDFSACFRPGRRCAFRFLCLAESREKADEARAMFKVESADAESDIIDETMIDDEGNKLPF